MAQTDALPRCASIALPTVPGHRLCIAIRYAATRRTAL